MPSPNVAIVDRSAKKMRPVLLSLFVLAACQTQSGAAALESGPSGKSPAIASAQRVPSNTGPLPPPANGPNAPDLNPAAPLPSLAPLVKRLKPSVVSVYTTQSAKPRQNPRLGMRGGPHGFQQGPH